eukprot:gene12153-biopygen392
MPTPHSKLRRQTFQQNKSWGARPQGCIRSPLYGPNGSRFGSKSHNYGYPTCCGRSADQNAHAIRAWEDNLSRPDVAGEQGVPRIVHVGNETTPRIGNVQSMSVFWAKVRTGSPHGSAGVQAVDPEMGVGGWLRPKRVPCSAPKYSKVSQEKNT